LANAGFIFDAIMGKVWFLGLGRLTLPSPFPSLPPLDSGVHGRPQEGAKGSPDPLDFDINFSHIITVAPRVEIQMHFWKGAQFAGSVRQPMTKMLSASGGFAP